MALAVMLLSIFGQTLTGTVVDAQAAENPNAMYRLYNKYTGEHFYTSSFSEKSKLVIAGWGDEGIGWYAPVKSNTPVYRLYNPYAGDHHYTTSTSERNNLKKGGWKDEGVGWYSDDAKGVPVYRQYNPNAQKASHNYTTSKAENDSLVKAGWKAEGIGWYGVKNTVYAVYSSTDSSLRFYNRATKPTQGSTWNDGSQKNRIASNIYNIDLNNFQNVDWASKSSSIKTITFVDSGINPVYMDYWFCNFTSLQTADLSKLDGSKLKSLYALFAGSSNLTTVNLAGVNTSTVENYTEMFAGCQKLAHIYVSSNWKIKNKNSGTSMFYGCKSLPNWNSKYIDATKAFVGNGGYLEYKK